MFIIVIPIEYTLEGWNLELEN